MTMTMNTTWLTIEVDFRLFKAIGLILLIIHSCLGLGLNLSWLIFGNPNVNMSWGMVVFGLVMSLWSLMIWAAFFYRLLRYGRATIR